MRLRYFKLGCECIVPRFLYVFFRAFYTLMNNDVTPRNAQYLLNIVKYC
jgi:hypothetical protein